MSFNPNAPAALGCQWFPKREPASDVNGSFAAFGAAKIMEESETIRSVWLNFSGTGWDNVDGWELEIYDMADMSGGNVHTLSFYPDEDAYVNGMFGFNTGSGAEYTPNLYTLIDNPTLTPDTYNGKFVANDTWIGPIFGYPAEAAFRFASLAGTMSGKQVLALTLNARAQEWVDLALVAGATFTPFLRIGDVRYLGTPTTITGESTTSTPFAHTWYGNPATGASWKPSEVDEFDTGTSAAGWMIAATGSANNWPMIFVGDLEVMYADDDPRVAVGRISDPIRSWNEITLESNTGVVTPWAKTAGKRYMFVVRKRTGSYGWVSWRYLTDDVVRPNGWARCDVPIDPYSLRLANGYNGDLTLLGDTELTGGYAILLEVNGTGAISEDSQPYSSINDDVPGGDLPVTNFTRVNAAFTLEQDITTDTSLTYAYLRSLVATESPTTTDDLTLKLRRRSDDVVMATVIVEPEDLAKPRTAWQTFEDFFTPVLLAATTQYYVEMTCPAARGEGWRVQGLSGGTVGMSFLPGQPPANIGTATYGGVTDTLWVNGVQSPARDAAVTIHTLPSPPTGATLTEVAFDTNVNFARIAWTGTALSADFEGYEVDRSTDGGTSWERIKNITSEATVTFDDYEGGRNVARTYRVRVRRRDGAPSTWATTNGATISAPCGYTFTSNEAQSYSLFYNDDTDGERKYEPIALLETRRFTGRNGAVAFTDLEIGGDTFTTTLLVASDGGLDETVEVASPQGRAAFNDLLVLLGVVADPATNAKMVLPYIDVLDENGNEWRASVAVQVLRRNEPGGGYTADIVVTTTAWEPYVSDELVIGS